MGVWFLIFIVATILDKGCRGCSGCGGCSDKGAIKNERVEGGTLFAEVKINKDAGDQVLLALNEEFGGLIRYVWKVSKSDPNISNIDVKLIITGDNGYGYEKTFDWCHLRFYGSLLDEIKRYKDYSTISDLQIDVFLESAGMKFLEDSEGNLSREAFR